MKKHLLAVLGVLIALALSLSACGILSGGASLCHGCGKSVGNDPVKAGGRTYCSYDCYMSEVLFG